MRVAIVGGGFTGLAAGMKLAEDGDKVVVFEAEKKLGGMGVSFKNQGWDWNLERYYHHIFANDKAAIEMAKKVGLPAFFRMPKTNSLINGTEKRLDSPLSLLVFSDISLLSRLRMGAGLLLMKLIRNGNFLEGSRVVDVLPLWVGREGYEKIWKPLLVAKFGPYLPEVNLAWFWARVFKRTQALGYFEGGYQALADKMGEYIESRGGVIKMGSKVKTVKPGGGGSWWVNDEKFDQVLITSPAPLVDKLVGEEKINWPRINYLWAQTLILELEHSLMRGYWLNILDKNFPFMVVVEQTNFIDRKHYGNKVIVYLGNYLSHDDKRLKMSEDQLLNSYIPFLKKINPDFEKKWISKSWYFEMPYAQPVFPVNYSRAVPSIKTNLPGLFVANMSMVYPWDRGTNYAVELGQTAALIMKNG